MDLTTLLSTENVKVPMEAYDKEEAIAELLELLVRNGTVPDREQALEALYEREDKGSTGIGGGVAIPHAKCEEMDGVALAVGISRDGIEFDAVDDEPVHVVFLVMAEAHNPGPNVETLAEIGNLMQVPGVYEDMVEAPDAAALIRTIDEAQVEQ
jgi:mannitol/fructose-specific phosphotransferase system IIA component (Ntr-type)